MRLATLSENEIIVTLIALALLLLSAFVFGTLIEKIKGPRVVGEIIGGMIVGGSCLFLLAQCKNNQLGFRWSNHTSHAWKYSVFQSVQRKLYWKH